MVRTDVVLTTTTTTTTAVVLMLFMLMMQMLSKKTEYHYDQLAARNHQAERQLFLEKDFPAGNTEVHCFTIHDDLINVTVVHVAPLMRHPPPQSPPPPVLFVHGIGSSAALILTSPAARSLRETHDLYAVDVPGLVGAGPEIDQAIAAMSADEYLAVFKEVLDRLLLVHLPAPPIIVAHSLGAFLVSDTTLLKERRQKNQKKGDDDDVVIAGVVLVSPAGVVPRLGVLGPFWTLFFRAGLPGALLRPLARIWLWLLDKDKKDLILVDRTYYWMHVQAAAPRANVAAKFIAGWTPFAVWTRPQVDHIRRASVPTVLVWGEEDALAPMGSKDLQKHVEDVVQAVEVMPGVGHSVLLHPDSGAMLKRVVRQLHQ